MVKLHKRVDIDELDAVDTDLDTDLSVHVGAESDDRPESGSDDADDKVYFMALGGLEHVGQNMYLYKYKGKFMVVDCGMGF